jgi:hypothetical protein
MPRLVGIGPRCGGLRGALAASGRDTSLVWQVTRCVCRVWSGSVRRVAGHEVRLPRLVGIGPRCGGLRGAFAAFGRYLWTTSRADPPDPTFSCHAEQ